jgi:hypothetical protein
MWRFFTDDGAEKMTDTIAAGALVDLAHDLTRTEVTALGDNQAGVNLPAITGLAAVMFDVTFQFIGANNTAIEFEAELHTPGHAIIGTVTWRVADLGAGNSFKAFGMWFGRDLTPEVGDYHINVNVFTGWGGAASFAYVDNRRLIGVRS